MDDWQDTAFSHKHVHNRVSKSGKSSKKGGAVFNVRNVFGSYEIDCRAHARLASNDSTAKASMEIFGLTSGGEGLHGQLVLPGALKATVLLAASRRSMMRVVASIAQQPMSSEDSDDSGSQNDETDKRSQGGSDDASQEHEGATTAYCEPFEKNTFRSPKFWLKWQGSCDSDGQSVYETNDGYVVFTPDVVKLSGTITSQTLGWKNQSFSGRKLKTMTERDHALVWQA